MKPATPSQLKVLSFIRGRLMTRGRPPTRKDIANAFGWASLNAAQETIEALRKKGLLRPPKEPRIACILRRRPTSCSARNLVTG